MARAQQDRESVMYYDYNVPASIIFETIIHDDTQHVRAWCYLPPQPLTRSDMAFWKLYASEWRTNKRGNHERTMNMLHAQWAQNNLYARAHMNEAIRKGHLEHECIPTLEQFNREMRHWFMVREQPEHN